MTRFLRIAAPLAALALSACFGGAKAPNELLTLTATSALPAGAIPANGEGIVVLPPSVPRALAANRIAVYVSPVAIQYLTDAVWVDQPGNLFRRLLGETIAARTGRTVIDPANYSQQQALVLNGQLLQFGLDPTRNEAVVMFDAVLTRSGGGDTRARRFEARVPVTAQTALVVTPALNEASNNVAQQIADWVGR